MKAYTQATEDVDEKISDIGSDIYCRNCTYGGSSHLLADVLSGERTATRSAFKTTDVPLSLQSQQRLTLFDLLATACTV